MTGIFTGAQWAEIFTPLVPFWETVARGSITYFALVFLLRVLSKEPSTLSIPDLLVIVLIADASQNAMAGGYTSLTDGILLVAVILFWSRTLDILAFRFKAVSALIHPPPLPLIKDGVVIVKNLRREYISRDELMSQLREQGIEDISRVKKAYMEGDGHISVIVKGA